jgi:hypothetical protein
MRKAIKSIRGAASRRITIEPTTSKALIKVSVKAGAAVVFNVKTAGGLTADKSSVNCCSRRIVEEPLKPEGVSSTAIVFTPTFSEYCFSKTCGPIAAPKSIPKEGL